MMPETTLSHEMMLDYISGSLPAPLQVMVASHMALNKEAESDFQALSELGGELLEDEAPVAMSGMMSGSDIDALIDRMEKSGRADGNVSRAVVNDISALNGNAAVKHDASQIVLPDALRDQLDGDLDSIQWNKGSMGVREYVLPITQKGLKASLLWIEPGRKIPAHTHKGREYTLILGGAYTDEAGSVTVGDFVCNDGAVEHSPLADSKYGCLCYVVQDAPLKFKGLFGMLVNPFLKV